MEYFDRTADKFLSDLLDAFGAVLIEGPKWCGKTTTAEQQAKSILTLQDTDMREEYLATARTKPSYLLQGDTPRLIDEWQDAPMLWDAVRTVVDKRREPGQFILTGSNKVDRAKTHHSGTGRIARMRMLPMSLWESKESTGEISIGRLFDNVDYDIEGKMAAMTVEDLIFAACRGGWPASLFSRTDKAKLMISQNYLNSVCSEDISRIDDRPRNEKLALHILKAYSRNISTLAKSSSLLKDVTEGDSIECTRPTFDDYVSAFEKLFVIQDIDAWGPAIRSKTAIRSAPKRGFCDPSIAVAALGLTPDALKMQLKTFGFIFEQMCIRDLKAYTIDMNSHVSYYRDRYGLEADVVLHLQDGRYALIECKLGSREIEEGAKHLLKIRDLIREKNQTEKQVPIREPDLMIILTGGKMAYTRNDGVKVITLATLKP
ncbi:MAG: ATP-binding protein [Bacteroidales bacterium]|nr:ATP-binding protein [Bacteroidales bacterium]